MAKTTKKRAPKITSDEFVITLQLGQMQYSGTGATALDALISMPKPDKINLKGLLTIEQGKLKKQIIYMPDRLRRLFYNRYFQAIQAKNLTLGMK